MMQRREDASEGWTGDEAGEKACITRNKGFVSGLRYKVLWRVRFWLLAEWLGTWRGLGSKVLKKGEII